MNKEKKDYYWLWNSNLVMQLGTVCQSDHPLLTFSRPHHCLTLLHTISDNSLVGLHEHSTWHLQTHIQYLTLHTHISSVNSKQCFQWHCGDKMKSCDVFLVVILAPFDWGTQRSKAFPVILIGTSTLILPFTTFLPSRSLFIYIIRNCIVILNSSPVHKHY